jgi:NTE family protein
MRQRYGPGMAALVLGGGGVTGIAWTTGLLLGMAEGGEDLTSADLVVGTSAGAAVGAQVTTGRSLEELYEAQLAESSSELAAELDLTVLGEIFSALAADQEPSPADLARVGSLALAAPTVGEPLRRAVIEARLRTDAWPANGHLRITAVDVDSGDLVVFDGTDGVGLIDAVTASCAVPGVWPPVTIGSRRYMDGGVRSVSNADLACGHDWAVVVLPLGGSPDRQVQVLREAGAEVTVLTADAEALEAFGPNPLDPTRRRPAAEAGLRQGRALRSG